MCGARCITSLWKDSQVIELCYLHKGLIFTYTFLYSLRPFLKKSQEPRLVGLNGLSAHLQSKKSSDEFIFKIF